MDRGARTRLSLVLLVAFGGTAWAVLARQGEDRLLAVERWAPAIEAAASEAQLPDGALLGGLVYAESKGDATAVSATGARGLCQVLPSTAEELALRHTIPGPPFSPEDNLRLGAWYLAELLVQWEGDVDLALLSYRLGPGAVSRAVREAGSREAWKESLRRRKPSAWEWRTQVLRVAARFRERAAAGLAVGWGGPPP